MELVASAGANCQMQGPSIMSCSGFKVSSCGILAPRCCIDLRSETVVRPRLSAEGPIPPLAAAAAALRQPGLPQVPSDRTLQQTQQAALVFFVFGKQMGTGLPQPLSMRPHCQTGHVHTWVRFICFAGLSQTPQVEQTWAPYYPLNSATPADYTNLPCTYQASESAPIMQGRFDLSLPGFTYDGQYWVPVGGTRFTTFTIKCSTPSPPPPPPRCDVRWGCACQDVTTPS